MTCPCGEPTPDTATVGPACRERYERDLGDIPALVHELELTLSRQTASGSRVGGRSSEKPLPYDQAASDALGALRVTLVGWVQVLNLGEQWPADTLEAMSRWLLSRVVRAVHHEAGGEIVDEVHDRVTQARRSYARSAPERAYVGPCGAEADKGGTVCGADLYARFGAETCICAQCGAEYNVAVRREWLLASAEDTLLTTGEIAKALPLLLGVEITAERVRKWAQRDRIVAHGVDTLGRPLYRVGDVRALVEARAKGVAA